MTEQKIVSGFEHRMFFVILRDALRSGTKHVADWGRRKQWLEDNPDQPAAMYLIAALSYTEGVVGTNWAEDHGGARKRELCVLRILRNALVHESGELARLANKQRVPLDEDPVRKREGKTWGLIPASDAVAYVRTFEADLVSKRHTEPSGTPIESYFTVDAAGKVELLPEAFERICGLMTRAFGNAGEIQWGEEE